MDINETKLPETNENLDTSVAVSVTDENAVIIPLPNAEPAEAMENTEATENAPETMGQENKVQPFPAEDYKDGKLKPVRKRMLKKLLKYEFRALFPYLFTLVVLLIGFATVFGVHTRLAEQNEKLKDWVVLTGMLYGFCNLGLLIISYSKAHQRYKNNFFGDEGYLTFSIPATADEHLLAKHLSLLVSLAISWGAIILGGAIFGLITEGFKTFSWIGKLFNLYGAVFKLAPWHTLFYTIELLLICLLPIPLLPCSMGAGLCWKQKHGAKSRFRRRLLSIFLGFAIYYVIMWLTIISGFWGWVFFNEIGLHLVLWVIILIMAGATVWAYWYERKTLKRNLNLQ